MINESFHSPLLPGGDLIAATLDRSVMGIADRGGASGLVGARWADLCAEQVASWSGRELPIPMAGGAGDGAVHHEVDRVVRLDDTPEIAATAASKALQNPDFLIVGHRHGRTTIQAADAKFSVETARAKQVTSDVIAGLFTLGALIIDRLGPLEDPALVDGIFLVPDFPLTHLMFRRRHGIVRTTVRPDQVQILPAPAATFFTGVEGASVMRPIAAVDRLPASIDESLLAALYYFRLARAAVGCWLDATGPLLAFNDRREVDEAAVRTEAERRAAQARSGWDLILNWDADVQSIRGQRQAVEQVAGLPLPSRELRELISRMAETRGGAAPSVNKVRRRVGAWYRGKLREQFGPIVPPVDNLPGLLRELGRFGASLERPLQRETARVIAELLAETTPSGLVVSEAASG